jgi:hypothetical protein
MNLRSALILLVILGLLTGCTPVSPIPAVEIPSATPLPTYTRTARPPSTVMDIPSSTPTFDPATIVRVTPAEAAVCPGINPSLKPEIKFPRSQEELSRESDLNLLLSMQNFLNRGGKIEFLLNEIDNSYVANNYRYQDLNDDKIPELLYWDEAYLSNIYIFYCHAGQYEMFTDNKFGVLSGWPRVIAIQDLNLNGLPDIVVEFGSCSGSGCWEYLVYEWNGNTFRNIAYDETRKNNKWPQISGQKEFRITDINNDGLQELVLTGDKLGPCCVGSMTPWRYKTVVYSWNGHIYAESYVTFDKAQYRFQAIQDADREVGYGNYDIALAHYQEAIFNNELGWWTKERRDYDVSLFYASFDVLITPTPSPYPKEDITERPRLVAYAYYRIMLLHIIRGFDLDASATYHILQEKIPADDPSYPYVKMATAFWDTYYSTHKLTNACGAAIEYAAAHPDILIPLGSDYHGMQSHTYQPEDVCPFR